MPGSRHSVTLLCAAMLMSACAGHGSTVLERYDRPIELADVAFYPQVTDQCGPSALAALLDHAGVHIGPEELRSRIYIPGRHGSLQVEILAATRHYGRLPYLIDGDISALLEELYSGRPILILQNLGPRLAPIWHYAVVVGYQPERREFVLRSGDQERHRLGARAFLRSWQRADSWALVALPPGSMPTRVDVSRYLAAAAAFETVAAPADAAAVYRAAAVRWPGEDIAWLGLGNTSYASGDLPAARTAYRRALDAEPTNVPALNNWSQVHAELGCREAAMTAIDAALQESEADSPLYGTLLETRDEIDGMEPDATCL